MNSLREALRAIYANVNSDALKGSGTDSAIDKITPNPKLSPREAAIEQQNTLDLQQNKDAAIRKYIADNTENGTTTVNVTQAKEQFPDYRATRLNNGLAVHEPAAALSSDVYHHLLKSDTPGKLTDVLLASGGRAAGKTTAINDFRNNFGVFVDTHGRDKADYQGMIEDALRSGRNANLVWVDRDPKLAIQGLFQRAADGGRMVPISNFVDTHVDGANNFLNMVQTYQNNPRVRFEVLDNNRPNGGAKPGSLGQLGVRANADKDALTRQLLAFAEREHGAGRLPGPLYDAFIDRGGATASQAAQQPSRVSQVGGVSDGGESQPEYRPGDQNQVA